MAQVVDPAGERECPDDLARRGITALLMLGWCECAVPGLLPGTAVGDRCQLPALDAYEDAAIAAGAESVKVRAENPGQRRRHGHPSPLPTWPGFELPVVAAAARVSPLGADLGGGQAEAQLPPVVGGFLPLARGRVPYQRRQREVVTADIDRLFRSQGGVVDDGEERDQSRAAWCLLAYRREQLPGLAVVDDAAPVNLMRRLRGRPFDGLDGVARK